MSSAGTRPRGLYYRILRYQPQNHRRLQEAFELTELDDPSQDTPQVLREAQVLFAPLGFPVDRRKIDACSSLRVIASNTTGHPHIDVQYARRKGIAVACLKFAPQFLRSITPTAELAWGLVIALTRRIIPAHLAALGGTWDRRPFPGAAMLSRMALGVVGHGRLGAMVARYGKASGMRVLYYDPYLQHSAEGAERCGTLQELVARSDIVSIHVPHEAETEKMFDRQIFGCFKRGGYLVNTARGELLDWEALLEALKSGQLAGAALDVFEGEFEPGFPASFKDHPLLDYARSHPNVILTPHIGGSTVDAWAMTEAHTIDMALAAMQPDKPAGEA